MDAQPEPRQEGDHQVRPARERLIAAVEKMRSALSEFANDDNWFSAYENDDGYNTVPGWRGPHLDDPEVLASEALLTEDISALVEQVVHEAMLRQKGLELSKIAVAAALKDREAALRVRRAIIDYMEDRTVSVDVAELLAMLKGEYSIEATEEEVRSACSYLEIELEEQ
jgi:hypothetical protein